MPDTLTLPSAREAGELIGVPADEWTAKCHAISSLIVQAGIVEGNVRRGWFIGETKPGAYFHGRPAQHSWIGMPDGRVCDPTRHAFVGGEPELWIGSDEEYDVGGMKTQGRGGEPPSIFDDEGEQIELNVSSVGYFGDLLGIPSEFRSDGTEGDEGDDEDDAPAGDGWLMISFGVAHYLANLPVFDREGPGILSSFFAAEAYEALEAAGHRALIPIDRWEFVIEESRRARQGRG
jgi:hypothetical protein